MITDTPFSLYFEKKNIKRDEVSIGYHLQNKMTSGWNTFDS